MSNDPYRPHGGPGDELARLAQQGQARLQAAHRSQDRGAQEAADRNLRTAIGPVRGAPMKRAFLVLLVLSVLGAIAGVLVIILVAGGGGVAALNYMPIAFVGISMSFVLLFLYLFSPPMASRAGVEAERAWAASLPFALEHYFDVIAAEPDSEVRLRVELWWTAQGVDAGTLQGIIALMDTQSGVLEARGAYAAFATGPISGSTGIRINRANVYRNHRLGTAVHRLVDVVLMPIHQSRPLARVRLSRI